MENLDFTETGNKLLEIDLVNIENLINIKLPNQYRAFLQKWNGGIPNKVYFSTIDNDYVLNELLSIDTNQGSFLDYWILLKNNITFFEKSLIPIGDDTFGNILCLDSSGKVNLWLHEFDEVVFISEDFNQFLSLLKEDI